MSKTTLHCATCQKIVYLHENVNLDKLNTITHAECTTVKQNMIKDSGTFKAMIEKYPFFDTVLA